MGFQVETSAQTLAKVRRLAKIGVPWRHFELRLALPRLTRGKQTQSRFCLLCLEKAHLKVAVEQTQRSQRMRGNSKAVVLSRTQRVGGEQLVRREVPFTKDATIPKVLLPPLKNYT